MLLRSALGGGVLLTGGPISTAITRSAAATPDGGFVPRNRFPRMVQEYFVRRLRVADRANHEAKGALRTREDAEAYVRSVREHIQESFGPFPEKTPLNPRTTGVVERDEYRIEKIIFESRPGFLVTGNLYVPRGRAFPLPGVVGTCGHSNTGKAAESYQAFSQGLARKGYVVFIIDPIGQGERLQYVGESLKSWVGVGVREHLYAGNQQFLVGEFIGAWRAWDGIRALDYLLTREEVDPRYLGVTGNSGGGTMTTWLCGLESRWTMAAPSCFVTTFRRNLENELPADTEQCPPRALALGLDHEDFIAAMAPKPVILLAKEKDFFDIRGTEEAYARLKRLYGLLGAEENIALFAGPTSHGYSQENREAMYSWFNRVTGVSDLSTEAELTIEDEATIRCTPEGQVSGLKSRTVFSFTRERSLALRTQGTRISTRDLKQRLRDVLQLRPGGRPPRVRILRSHRSQAYPLPHATTYAVETESGIQAIVYRLGKERLDARPPRTGNPALLYVAHHSSDRELRDEPLIRDLLTEEASATLYTCDVRGIGESQPDTCGDDSFLNPYGSDYFYAVHSLMLGEPYLGQKTRDVLRVVDWLQSRGHSFVHMVGAGWGSLPATFASLLSPIVTRVTLKHALTSYAEVAESERYSWPLSTLLPGVLWHFDLPDCYRVLKRKSLRQIEPWGAQV
jgi:dienelactone hydrolase